MDLLYYNLDKSVEAFTTRKEFILPYYVIQPHQTHGDNIAIIQDKNTGRDELFGIDALITNLINCPIAVRTADCVPILLFDPINKVVAAIHSGWRGTVKMISAKVIRCMRSHFGTRSEDLKAIIGPSIGPESFKVHKDVIDAFCTTKFPMDIISKQADKATYYVDLWSANKWILEQEGLKSSNIQIVGICTYMQHDEFYSARYEKNNKCGRNINVIRIKTDEHY